MGLVLPLRRNGPKMLYRSNVGINHHASTRISTRTTNLGRSFRQSPLLRRPTERNSSVSFVNVCEKGVRRCKFLFFTIFFLFLQFLFFLVFLLYYFFFIFYYFTVNFNLVVIFWLLFGFFLLV